MSIHTAVVLAAGEGTRLRPLTRHRPKPMLPAATKPILEHVLDQVVDAGISEIVLVVGYGRNRVQSHFGSSYRDVPLTYVNQEKQLGSAHALLQAEQAIDGSYVVVNGDQIVDSRIVETVIDQHDEEAVATLGMVHQADVDGHVGVLVEDGRVQEIVHSPQDDQDYRLNVGIYAFEPQFFDPARAVTPRAGEHQLVDAVSAAIDAGDEVRGVLVEGFWVHVTYPWDLLDVSFELFEMGIVDGSHRSDSRGRSNTSIHDSAEIREPVVIGSNCEIGPGAVVGPRVCLGNNTTIGSNAVVESSVVDADTRIGPGATVIDCVTGIGVDIGAGTTIPGGPGDVRVGNHVFENEALGALLADRVRDQGGVEYVPGSIVGPDATIETGSVVRGTLSEGTEVRS